MLNANVGEHRCSVVRLNMLTLASFVRVNIIVNSSELAGFKAGLNLNSWLLNLICSV